MNFKTKHKFSPSYVSHHHTKGADNNISEDRVEKQWRVERGAVKCCLLEATRPLTEFSEPAGDQADHTGQPCHRQH